MRHQLFEPGAQRGRAPSGRGATDRARYEFVLFFEKGKRKLNDLSVPDIIEATRVWAGYPTEKPVEVSEILVRQSSGLGEIVIDPFCGSGSVGVAAANLGRSFWGCDVGLEALSVTRRRLLDTGAAEEVSEVSAGQVPLRFR